MRLITSKIWNFQRVLHTVAATQEVPRHTRLHSRGSTRVPPTSRGARFYLLAREEGSFPCVVGKEFPAFPSYLKRRPSPQERREELQGRATIPRFPQMSQSIPGKRVFPALPRLSSRGSTHITVARGTTLWESLVGKPRGKATDPLIQAKGSTRVPLTSRGAPLPPPSSRGGIFSLRGWERIPGVTVASQEEALSSGKARGTPGSCHHSQRPPDVSVHSRENYFPCTASTLKPRINSHHGGTWDIPVGKPQGKAPDALIHAKGSVTLLLQLGRKAHVHAPTRDED